jgi:hypothetical protein
VTSSRTAWLPSPPLQLCLRRRVDSDEPLDTDPVDVWVKKRDARVKRNKAGGDIDKLAALPLTDDLPPKDWIDRRNAQKKKEA